MLPHVQQCSARLQCSANQVECLTPFNLDKSNLIDRKKSAFVRTMPTSTFMFHPQEIEGT